MAEKFARELKALYSGDKLACLGPFLTATTDLSSIQSYVHAPVKSSFQVPELKDDDDLYVLGLDSLKTIEIAGILKAGIRASNVS